jgi:light-regulated signal transduction histidine kinase (bacteriophytochrome)
VLANLQASLEESGANVTWGKLPRVMFEPVRMEQLLQNLVSNALKYRGDSAPVVHVSARERKGEIEFAVTDNGIGIAPQYQDEIFGIFKRLHGKEIEGTGVGLATCKRIVEEHGGRIWVESVVGQGSTFRFTVPTVRPATARGQVA